MSSTAISGASIDKFDNSELEAISSALYLALSTSNLIEVMDQRSEPPSMELTPRQKSILSLMAQGKTNLEIGAELEVSESLIKHESVKIFKGLGAKGREQAVDAAKQSGLIGI